MKLDCKSSKMEFVIIVWLCTSIIYYMESRVKCIIFFSMQECKLQRNIV